MLSYLLIIANITVKQFNNSIGVFDKKCTWELNLFCANRVRRNKIVKILEFNSYRIFFTPRSSSARS